MSAYPIPDITVLLSNKIKYSYDEGFFINGGTAGWAY